MRAKFVSESLSDESHEERMRKRREEFERETRELARKSQEDSKMGDASSKPEEEIRYGLMGDLESHYELDDNGRPQRRKESKERSKAERKEYAKQQVLASEALLIAVEPTRMGIEDLENWEDEEGEGIDSDDWVLRSQKGDGLVVAYQREGVDKERYQKVITVLKMYYGVMNDILFKDVRPIMFKNWLKKDFEGKTSTLKDGEVQKRGKRKKVTDIIGDDYD